MAKDHKSGAGGDAPSKKGGAAGPFFFIPTTAPLGGVPAAAEEEIEQSPMHRVPSAPAPVASSPKLARMHEPPVTAPMMMNLEDIQMADSSPPVRVSSARIQEARAPVAAPIAAPPSNARVEELEAQLEQAQATVAAGASTADRLREEVLHKKLEISNLLRRLADVDAGAGKEQQRIHALETELAAARQEIASRDQQLASLGPQAAGAASLQQQFQQQEAELAEARADIQEASNAIALWQTQHGELGQQLDQAQADLVSAQAQATQQQARLVELEQRLVASDAQAKSQSRAQAELSSAQALATQQQARLVELEQRLVASDAQAKSLSRSLEQVEAGSGQLNAHVRQLQVDSDAHAQRALEATQRADQLQQALEEQQALTQDAVQEHQAAAQQASQLQRQMQDLESSYGKKKQDVERLTARETELVTNTRRLNGENAQMAGELRTLRAQNAELAGQVETLSAQVQAVPTGLPQELETLRASFDAEHAHNQELERHAEELRDLLVKTQASLHQIQTAGVRAASEMAALAQAAQAQEARAAQAEEALGEAFASEKAARAQVEALQRDLQSAAQAVQALQAEVAAARATPAAAASSPQDSGALAAELAALQKKHKTLEFLHGKLMDALAEAGVSPSGERMASGVPPERVAALEAELRRRQDVERQLLAERQAMLDHINMLNTAAASYAQQLGGPGRR